MKIEIPAALIVALTLIGIGGVVATARTEMPPKAHYTAPPPPEVAFSR